MGGILIPFPAPADWVRGLNIRAREVGLVPWSELQSSAQHCLTAWLV